MPFQRDPALDTFFGGVLCRRKFLEKHGKFQCWKPSAVSELDAPPLLNLNFLKRFATGPEPVKRKSRVEDLATRVKQ